MSPKLSIVICRRVAGKLFLYARSCNSRILLSPRVVGVCATASVLWELKMCGDDYDHARSVCLTESVCVSHNFCVTHLSDCERLSVNVSQALFRV